MAEFNYDNEIDEIIANLKGTVFDMERYKSRSENLELMSNFGSILESTGKLLKAVVEREHAGRDDGKKVVGRLVESYDMVSQDQDN